MAHLSGAYSSLLIPGILAVIVLVVVLRVVHAVVRLVGILVLVAVLVSGYTMYSRVAAIQKAIEAAQQNRAGTFSAAAIAGAVGNPARQALVEAGLDPTLLRIRVVCTESHPQVQLRYADHGFPYGLLSQQVYTVPVTGNARC